MQSGHHLLHLIGFDTWNSHALAFCKTSGTYQPTKVMIVVWTASKAGLWIDYHPQPKATVLSDVCVPLLDEQMTQWLPFLTQWIRFLLSQQILSSVIFSSSTFLITRWTHLCSADTPQTYIFIFLMQIIVLKAL